MNRIVEQTWGTYLGTDLECFSKLVKDNVVTKIHTFKNKNDFKTSGDIFFCGKDLGNRLGYRLGNRIYELAYYSNLDLA